LSVLPDISDEDSNDVGIGSVLRADKEAMGIVSVVEGKLVINVIATIAKVVIVKVATGILNWAGVSTAVDPIVEGVTGMLNWAGVSTAVDVIIEARVGASDLRIKKLESGLVASITVFMYTFCPGHSLDT
jgi:hypothetical protein